MTAFHTNPGSEHTVETRGFILHLFFKNGSFTCMHVNTTLYLVLTMQGRQLETIHVYCHLCWHELMVGLNEHVERCTSVKKRVRVMPVELMPIESSYLPLVDF